MKFIREQANIDFDQQQFFIKNYNAKCELDPTDFYTEFSSQIEKRKAPLEILQSEVEVLDQFKKELIMNSEFEFLETTLDVKMYEVYDLKLKGRKKDAPVCL